MEETKLVRMDSALTRGISSFVQKYRSFREEQNLEAQEVTRKVKPEDDDGDTEYKLKLCSPSPDRV